MPDGYTVATLLGGVLSLWAMAGLLTNRVRTRGSRPASALRLSLGAAVGLSLIALATRAPQPVYAMIAGVAALTATAAIGVKLQVADGFGGPAYRLPGLSRVEAGATGSLTAAAAFAGAIAALVTVALAYRLRLLGPSDPGLVFLAAYVGMLLESWFDGAFSRRAASRPLGAAAATALAGLLAMLLAIALP